MPAAAATRVAWMTRSRATVRQTTTWTGTDPAIIAATLESIRVSATITTPTPHASRVTPSASADASSRRETRSGRPATRSASPSASPAARNRVPPEKRGGCVRTAILIAR
jgi:hypothetical protein